MVRLSLAVFIWLGAGFQASVAQVANPAFGYGLESCGTWLADRASNDATEDESWLDGYMTGAIAAIGAFAHENVTYSSDANAAYYWIDNDCRAYPTEQLQIAAARFMGVSGSFVLSPK